MALRCLLYIVIVLQCFHHFFSACVQASSIFFLRWSSTGSHGQFFLCNSLLANSSGQFMFAFLRQHLLIQNCSLSIVICVTDFTLELNTSIFVAHSIILIAIVCLYSAVTTVDPAVPTLISTFWSVPYYSVYSPQVCELFDFINRTVCQRNSVFTFITLFCFYLILNPTITLQLSPDAEFSLAFG